MDLIQFPFKRFYELCIVVSLLYISAWGYSHLERINSLIDRRDKWAQLHLDSRAVDLIIINLKIADLENQLDKANYTKGKMSIGMRGDTVTSVSYYSANGSSNGRSLLMDSLNKMFATRARIEAEIHHNRGLTNEINKRFLVVDIIGFSLLGAAICALTYGVWAFKNKAKT